MADKGIKSSIELAMEKVAKMPRLTEEELAEQKRKELSPMGRALALKFIEGLLDEERLKSELAAYPEDSSTFVKSALLSTLKQAVSLEDADTNRRLFEALDALGQVADATGLRQDAQKIAEDYQKEAERIREEYDQQYRASLHKRGVSGSALRPNLRNATVLKARLEEPRQTHGEKLARLLDKHVREES
jgi:hypothetical protein